MIYQSWRFAAFPLIAGSLAACSGIDGLPDVPRPDAVDAGGTLPLSDASEVADSTIPDAFVADGGADAATPDDAGPDSTVVDAAIDATIADAGPCVAESDTALCTQLGKNCGTLAAVDHCGTSRAISSCGSCAGFYDTCGGGGAANVCGCTPESDWSLCWRQGRSCGQASGTDNCGNSRSVAACGGACPADAGAGDATVPDGGTGGPGNGELSATTASMTGDGLNNCGDGTEPCARSILVPGGSYGRGWDRDAMTAVSDVKIDKYEATVGRFRRFVDAWVGGWRPPSGSGKHAHVRAGLGLTESGATSTESGWTSGWTAYVGAPSANAATPSAPGAALRSDWDSVLRSCASHLIWTAAVGENERKAQNCVSWYDAYAFCIWDGGFLPSEAEWENAAGGGSLGRRFPWGQTGPTSSHANYYSLPGTFGSIVTVSDRLLGAARWGHADLAGNVFEWVVDATRATPPATCTDCFIRADSDPRGARGGCFKSSAGDLIVAFRTSQLFATTRDEGTGFRCARSP